jgi:hypothetical protein
MLRTAAAIIGLVTSLLTLTHGWDRAVRTTAGYDRVTVELCRMGSARAGRVRARRSSRRATVLDPLGRPGDRSVGVRAASVVRLPYAAQPTGEPARYCAA